MPVWQDLNCPVEETTIHSVSPGVVGSGQGHYTIKENEVTKLTIFAGWTKHGKEERVAKRTVGLC